MIIFLQRTCHIMELLVALEESELDSGLSSARLLRKGTAQGGT
jgi:hypothetical protein